MSILEVGKIHGSRQTRLEAEFSALVGTPPPSKIKARMQLLKQASIVGWLKTMIEKQRVPGSSPAWKQKDFVNGIEVEVWSKIKISLLVVFGMRSQMVLIRGS